MRYVAAAAEHLAEDDLATAVAAALGDGRGNLMTTLAEKWFTQGKEQGIEQGIEQGLRSSILDLLEVRFGPVALALVNRLETIDDAATLRRLHRLAITVPSAEAFTAALDG